MFSHLRPIGALGADSSFLSFLVREGRPCYCDAEDIILIWLQQKATARRRRGDVPLATAAAAVDAPPLQGSPTTEWYARRQGRQGRPGSKGRRVGWRRLRARASCASAVY